MAMKINIALRYSMVLVLTALCFNFSTFLYARGSEPDTIRVYYLGGQSNMEGFGYNKDLPESLKESFNNVWIFHGNPVGDDLPGGGLGLWDPLQAGHGKYGTLFKVNLHPDV